MIFWKKKPVEDVKKSFRDELDDVRERLRAAETTLLDVTMEQKALRDKVLRKIQGKREKEEEESDEIEKKSKDLNSLFPKIGL